MTEQQQTAIAHPCQFAEQCAHARYLRITHQGNLTITVTLTVNIGFE